MLSITLNNKNKYLLILIILLLFSGNQQLKAQQTLKTVLTKDLYIRDPFILPLAATGEYFLYKACMVKDANGKQSSGVEVYKSKDLEHWTGPFTVFTTPADNWITGEIWAPEVHQYKGKYYLFATLNSNLEWKKQAPNWPKYSFRGTQIFYSKSPLGPFKPLGKTPQTPIDQMALDGTLWVENGKPYMVYCHEWVEIVDGTMEVIPLKKNLSEAKGLPTRLFNASAAPWSTGSLHQNGQKTYVTDGCFLYKNKLGKLLMIWSSFKNDKYAIGIAESTTGSVIGPWKQQQKPLFEENSGHGMLFKTFDNRLVLIFHGPNAPGGSERAIFYEIEDNGETLSLKNQLNK